MNKREFQNYEFIEDFDLERITGVGASFLIALIMMLTILTALCVVLIGLTK